MPDVQEVFRMVTQKAEPDPGALDRQHRRQRRRGANRRLAAFAAVASIAAAALVGVLLIVNRDTKPDDVPATQAPRGLTAAFYLMDIETGRTTPFPDPGPQAWALKLSPDGSRLAFTGSDDAGADQIFVMNIDGTGVRQVTHNAFGAQFGTWSPDATRIAYAGIAPDDSWEIFVLDLASGTSTRVTHRADDARYPFWAPDDKIAFESWDFVGGDRLLIVDPGSRQVSELAEDAHAPSWSPDGRQLVFTAVDSDGTTHLELANEDGTDPQAIRGAEGLESIWSPDGSTIAFRGVVGAGYDLRLYDVATGQIRSLLEDVYPESWVDADTILVSTR